MNLKKITELYCFVTDDENNEQIVAHSMSHPITNKEIMSPFIGADEEVKEFLKSEAKKICRKHKVKIKLIKLTNREEIETIDGN